jgi:hypothetical protein
MKIDEFKMVNNNGLAGSNDFTISETPMTYKDWIECLLQFEKSDPNTVKEIISDFENHLHYSDTGLIELDPEGLIKSNEELLVYNMYAGLVYCNYLSEKYGLTKCYNLNSEYDQFKWGKIPHDPSGNFKVWEQIRCDMSSNGFRMPLVSELKFMLISGSIKKADTYYEWCFEDNEEQTTCVLNNREHIKSKKSHITQSKLVSIGCFRVVKYDL